VVTPGVRVGRGCVIGANSVVNRSLPPYSIAVGASARVVQHRLTWNPPADIDATVSATIPYLYSGFEISYLDDNHIVATMQSSVLLALANELATTNAIVEITLRAFPPCVLKYGAGEFSFEPSHHCFELSFSEIEYFFDGYFILNFSISENPQPINCKVK